MRQTAWVSFYLLLPLRILDAFLVITSVVIGFFCSKKVRKYCSFIYLFSKNRMFEYSTPLIFFLWNPLSPEDFIPNEILCKSRNVKRHCVRTIDHRDIFMWFALKLHFSNSKLFFLHFFHTLLLSSPTVVCPLNNFLMKPSFSRKLYS